MEPGSPRLSCPCTRSHLSHTMTLLFLSLILPASSFAQLTTPLPRKPRSPTTLSISTVASSSSNSLSSTTQSSSPGPSTTAYQQSSDPASHAFNYYFLIIAAVVIFVSFGVLYMGRRKKRKAALVHTRGQRALARDVEGWRSRFGVGRASAYNNTINDADAEDGLDERGEAPPPYVPGSKPPSIRSEELRRPRASASHVPAQEMQLRSVGGVANPPGYHENINDGSADRSAEITRPGPVVTASERFGSIRRLMSNTGRSSFA